MISSIRNVLIIGGGFSGMSAAIELRKRGIDVDVVEIDPEWRSYGAGISIGGATLRAFRTLGILERFLKEGAASDGVILCAPDGTKLGNVPTYRVAGPDVPGGGGIMRPVLARILADATLEGGARVRLGCTFTAIEQDADGVSVKFTDGSEGRYDLVIGADGLYSSVRKVVLPDAPVPKYSGQGVWRAVVPIWDVEVCTMWVGPKMKAGVNPVSKDEMYLFLTEDRVVKHRIPDDQLLPMLKDLLSQFKAPLVQKIREHLNEDSQIIYRPLEGLLAPQPWHNGRIVLIGDTVHATTPHLASGACIGIEDAIVLAEELENYDELDEAIEAFEARRWERCRMVVENSARLGQIEIEGGDKAEHSRIMHESHEALAQEI